MNVVMKEMKTDSGNPMYVFFEEGKIEKPLFILQEYEMSVLKYYIETQTKNVKVWRGN